MAYNEIVELCEREENNYRKQLLMMKKDVFEDFDRVMVTCTQGMNYAGIKTALADFLYAFEDGFDFEKRDAYIKEQIENLKEERKNPNISSLSLQFSMAYESMLKLLAKVNRLEFLKLQKYLFQNRNNEDRNLVADSEYKRSQKEELLELVALVNTTFIEANEKNIIMHVGSTPKDKQAILDKNRALYRLLVIAVREGLEHKESCFKDDYDYDSYSVLVGYAFTPEEIDKYHRIPYNTICAFSDKNKAKLESKLSGKI